jgi:hypothetical protein
MAAGQAVSFPSCHTLDYFALRLARPLFYDLHRAQKQFQVFGPPGVDPEVPQDPCLQWGTSKVGQSSSRVVYGSSKIH